MTEMRWVAWVGCVLATTLLRSPARAEATDPSHGRFAGDLGVAAGAGVTFGPRAPRLLLDTRLRYLSTAGVFVSYEDGPLVGSSAEPRRALGGGVELRPLFLGKWGSGLETGNARVDLFVDSIALELGGMLVQPSGRGFASRPCLQAGIGLELPIFADATGPFVGLHVGGRWSEDALAGGPIVGPSDRSLFVSVTVGWQQLFGGQVAALGDPPR